MAAAALVLAAGGLLGPVGEFVAGDLGFWVLRAEDPLADGQ